MPACRSRPRHPDVALSNALCRTLGFELLGEVSVEYPKDHEMRSNDWRLDVGGSDGAAAEAQAS